MNILDPLHPLHSGIVILLGVSPGKTIEELHSEAQKYDEVSLSYFYKVVREMLDQQVLVKSKKKLYLNDVWVTNFLNFSEKVSQNYRRTLPGKSEVALQEGERRYFEAESLYAIAGIWNHILIQLIHISCAKDMYFYNAHAWHPIGLQETEVRLYSSIFQEGVRLHYIFGYDTPLDKYSASLVDHAGSITFDTDISLPKGGYHLNILGDYILEFFLPEQLETQFELFFKLVTREEDLQKPLYEDVYRQKVPCKIMLRRHAKDSEKLRNILEASINS